MKTEALLGIVIFLIGGFIGWQWSSQRDVVAFGKTLALLKEGQLVERLDQCNSAYFSQRWDVAAWESEQMNNVLSNELSSHLLNDKILQFDIFIVNARLAKAFNKIGDVAKSEAQVLSSINLMKSYGFNFGPVTNADTLFTVLERLDRIEMDARKAKGKG